MKSKIILGCLLCFSSLIVNAAEVQSAATPNQNMSGGTSAQGDIAEKGAPTLKPETPAKKVVTAHQKNARPALVGINGYVGDKNTKVKVNSKMMRSNTITVTGDGTETAMVSNKFPNRISTPFVKPRIIDASTISMQIDGSNIYVSPKTEEPFAIYITGSNAGDPVISLTLLPKDIPAQTITLQLDINSKAKRTQKIESYSQQLVDLLRQAATGKVPEGYSEAKLPNMLVKQDGVHVIPEVRYSGSHLDIYRYKVENNQSSEIELSESQFYQDGVKAVALFPNTILGKGETTNVYIVSDKSMLEGESANGR